MEKILVTGANGYIGRYLVKKLLQKDLQVVSFVRDLAQMPAWLLGSRNLEVVEGDLQDRKLVKKITKDVDVIYHLAAALRIFEKNGELYETNILGLKNLLQGCRKTNRPIKFIFASSIDAEKRLNTDYGKSKLKGEKIVQDFCGKNPQVEYVIVRIGNVYGGREGGMVEGIKKLLSQNNWKSSLLAHQLGHKHLYLVDMENLIKRLVGLIVEERAKNKQSFSSNKQSFSSNEILTLVDEEITVRKLVRRFKRNGLSKLPEKLPLGQPILKLWQTLGKILKRADLLIYLSLGK